MSKLEFRTYSRLRAKLPLAKKQLKLKWLEVLLRKQNATKIINVPKIVRWSIKKKKIYMSFAFLTPLAKSASKYLVNKI